MSDESQEELRRHNEAVQSWGGRVDSPAYRPLRELSNTVLGSTKVLQTSGATPILPAAITLAEMIVAMPISVDVSFAYPNLSIQHGVAFGTPGSPLQVGDGYVRVRWGTKGTVTHEARIDGNFGWRFPFVASHLIVDYVPIDVGSTGGRIIPVNQVRDLQISGMIAPSSGAPCRPLTRTLYFPEIAPGSASQQQTPLWASRVRPSMVVRETTTWEYEFFDTGFTQLVGYRANGVAGEFPNYVNMNYWQPVPQDGTIANVGVDAASPFAILEPKLIFQLAL